MGITRRQLLSGAGAMALALPSISLGTEHTKRRRPALRVVHLTDMHVQPEEPAPNGFRAAIERVKRHQTKADLVLVGGDMIMDSGGSFARTESCWRTFEGILDDAFDVPVRACIGNHDFSLRAADPAREKAGVAERLGLKSPYYSFDQGGWHFIVLDSVMPSAGMYMGCLDEPQFAWLERDLQATPADKPTLVMSHIPILTASNFFCNRGDHRGGWRVGHAQMHADARRIKDLFFKHPNVKVALSGHTHSVDRVDYLGVSYLCGGAVCGNWWKGKHEEFAPGYAVVDLHRDGSFDHRYVAYGGEAVPAGV